MKSFGVIGLALPAGTWYAPNMVNQGVGAFPMGSQRVTGGLGTI